MAKRKEDAEAKSAHLEFRARLDTAKAARDAVRSALGIPAVASILAKFKRDIDTAKEELCNAEKPADMLRFQAMVKARRAVVGYLENAHVEDVNEAQQALNEFERDNALLIQGATANFETGEVKEA